MLFIINLLTVSRIFVSIVIYILIANSSQYWLALILFIIAAITDYFDGYLARKFKLESQIGEILDPVADKILVIFALIALSINLNSFFIGFLSSLIISREIWVAALRDFNSRKGNVSATKVSYLAKVKTTFQLFTISSYILALSLNNMFIILITDMFLVISCLITIYTGFIYTRETFQKITWTGSFF